MGLIRPSNSPMASPIVCVAKKDGGVRLACDYRYLNSYTVGEAYPMATIDEVLRNVGQGRAHQHVRCKIRVLADPCGRGRSVVDGICDAWRTLRVGPDAIRTQECRCHFRQSCPNSATTNPVFCGFVHWRNGCWFWRVVDHLGHIRQFVIIMRNSGFTLNLAKCEFAKPEVKFVGRIVGSGIHRNPVHAII